MLWTLPEMGCPKVPNRTNIDLFIKALRVKDKRDSKLDTIDEDEEKSGHK